MASQFSELKKTTQFYFRVTLCNIHHRPFFRPYSMSTGSRLVFFCCFCFLIVADFSKKTLELQNTLPLFKTWIPSRPPISLKLLGKICKEEEAAVELCMRQTVLKSDTGYTTMHTSSLRATATPNRD